MRAGQYRRRIELQSSASTEQDESGQLRKDYNQILWTTYATVWARVVALQGQEAVNAKQLVANVTHQVTIRYRAGVSPQHRILYDGKRLEIQSALPTEDKSDLVMLCVEQGV